MEIIYSRDAVKFLAKQGKNTATRIQNAVAKYAEAPANYPNVKPVEGYSDGRLRIRVGDYRVVFRHDSDGTMQILFVIQIDNRGQIYKQMKRRK